ncbi:MAG: HAD family hydrolase [Cycloclasticus sp. symbiont of Poecilosclerida sp. M]|nr:MAG: HAD family hydrolase [Cycloclasticus sp. symbiont of Poecilosclerida sp. M]
MINWLEVNTVLLDMDGTLLDLQFDNYFWQILIPQRYADKNGLQLQDVKAYLQPIFKAQEGRLNWYCLDYWSDVLGFDVAELKCESQDRIQVLPHTRAFLSALQASGKRCILVTNAHVDSLVLKLKKTGLVEFFDAIVSAHDFGYAKEHQNFWIAFQRLEKFDVLKTLMVDDSLSVLKAAEKYGVRHLLAIAHPDSGESPREIKGFSSVHHLGEINLSASYP